jgi:capsular exopolysaccharide synthesis family protein
VAEQHEESFNIANLLQAQRDLLAGPAHPAGPPASPAGASGPEGDAFVNLKHYAYLVYGRKWWVLLVTLVVAGAAAFQWYARPRQYEAEAQVVLRESLVGSAGDIFGGARAFYFDTDALAKLAEMKDVTEAAGAQVSARLEERLKAAGERLSEEDRALVREQIARKVGLGPTGRPLADKYTVRLTAQAEGRSDAARLLAEARAAALAQALVDKFLAAVSGKHREQELKRLLDSNEAELAKISQYLLAAAVGQSEQELPPGMSEKLDYIQAQKKALMQTELSISEIGRNVEEMRKLLGGEKEELRVSPELQARLVRLYVELAEMENRYYQDNPKYLRKKDEIEALKKFMAEQGLDPELGARPGQAQMRADLTRTVLEQHALEARREALKGLIASASKDLSAGQTPEEQARYQAAITYADKLRERRSLEEINVLLRRKLSEARLLAMREGGGAGPALAEVNRVSPARPTGADLGQTLGFAAVLGLVLGVLLALLLEHLDDTVRSELSARRAANLPVIGKLPLFGGPPEKTYISAAEPRSDVAETFKVFHNHVRYASANAPEKCLLITSPGSEEGKSYVAVNLALSFASEGNRVCFVDADLRRSKTHERLDVLRPQGPADAGLCGFLDGLLEYESAVLATEVENLSVILAGGRAGNPPRALRSERMRELLERLDAEFDVVIIDAPPVLPVVDAAILASLVRAVVLVVRFGFTHMGDLVEASGRLSHVNAPLAGVVINAVHGAAAGYYYGYRYGYRYRYKYGAGYGYGSSGS